MTPNWTVRLPGHADPDGFMVRDEVVVYLERYGIHFLRTRKSSLLGGVGEDAAIPG